MCHQIDTIHWFTGLPHPRSVAANGGIYQWHDGRTNFDTLTAVFDYTACTHVLCCDFSIVQMPTKAYLKLRMRPVN